MIFGSAATVCAALAAAVMEQDDVAVFGLAHDILDDACCGHLTLAARKCSNHRDQSAGRRSGIPYPAQSGSKRDFFGVFRLMVDAVGRTEKNGFCAECALDEALGEIELPPNSVLVI